MLNPFVEFLRWRWNEGCRNAAQLWRETVVLGFLERPTTVRRWVGKRCHAAAEQGGLVAGPLARHSSWCAFMLPPGVWRQLEMASDPVSSSAHPSTPTALSVPRGPARSCPFGAPYDDFADGPAASLHTRHEKHPHSAKNAPNVRASPSPMTILKLERHAERQALGIEVGRAEFAGRAGGAVRVLQEGQPLGKGAVDLIGRAQHAAVI